MKKILIPLLIILVLALGAIFIIVITTTRNHAPIEKPAYSYRATFLESDGKSRVLTLELFKDKTARMITDPDTSPSSTLPHQVEVGAWSKSSETQQFLVTLAPFGAPSQETPSSFTFSKTEMGIEATEYDHERYPYSFMDFIEI